VTSADGIRIAFDRLGEGGLPVIVVGGASCDRTITRGTADGLARHGTVINHDRRGRGDSTDTAPYAVERRDPGWHDPDRRGCAGDGARSNNRGPVRARDG
jgi:hypothetical protein